jgi:hypothetical protein
MVFNETLTAYQDEVREAVDELFDAAFKNQKVNTDLLIVFIHGYLDVKHLEFHKKEKISPYVFGPEHIGYSLGAFYDFFHSYRTTSISKREFEDLLSDPIKKEAVEHDEELGMNIELLIYLKFWESDMLLRQLYNLVNLATGKYYDWSFTPPDLTTKKKKNNKKKKNDKKNNSGQFSRRPFIRNHIQSPIQTICPKFYELVKENYSAQIRNAIAHSKYYFLGRNIQLANKDENKYYELTNIPYADWEIRFHKTLLFYNFIIGNIQRYEKYYMEEVKDKHFGLALSTPKLSDRGLRVNQWVKYDAYWKRWLWSTQVPD